MLGQRENVPLKHRQSRLSFARVKKRRANLHLELTCLPVRILPWSATVQGQKTFKFTIKWQAQTDVSDPGVGKWILTTCVRKVNSL